ncbi:MAG: DMT family transporter [Parcubacteria group bacterium]|jgi:drug/metabolite transporter (DMT)-like permease
MFGFDGLTKERQGEGIIFTESFLWSLFPIITILALRDVSSSLALFWSMIFATVFFGLILIMRKGWKDLKNREAFTDILAATFIINIVYYLLFFNGLRYTTAGNASLIGLTEMLFSFLFFNVWRREYLSGAHIVGAVLMLTGAIIVLLPNIHRFQLGDLLILLACSVTPFGNYFQRRARKYVGSETILFVRSVVSLPVIWVIVCMSGVSVLTIDLTGSLGFLFINGFVMLGLSKILWIEGIHRISVTKATAINSIVPLMTLIFAWMILGNAPTAYQMASFIPMFFGVMLLGKNNVVEIGRLQKIKNAI